MRSLYQKKQENNNTISSVAEGVANVATAAVTITGIVLVATEVLKDKRTRERLKKVLVNVKDQAIGYIDTLNTESDVGKDTNAIKTITKDTKAFVEKSM